MQETLLQPVQESAQQTQMTSAQLVLKCIQAMNTEALYYLLDVERTYQDWQRNEFILKLEHVMKKFEAAGDTYLNAVQGACGGRCSRGQNGYLFIGNNSKNYMNLLFVEDELQLTDLYECSLFRTQFENLELQKRYYIDNRIIDFFEEFNDSLEA
ncbi:MAG: hypothetical protein ACKOWX_01535 [Flavobacteriales bacterium]